MMSTQQTIVAGRRRMSWAQAHQAQHEARLAAERAGTITPGAPMTGTAYELMLAALWADRRRLKDIKSIQSKIAAKRQMLPAYLPYIQGVLEAAPGAQDEVLMTVMAWSLDTGDLERALAIGAYAIGHGLSTPDRFERDTPSLLLEQLAEEVISLIEAHLPPAPWPADRYTPEQLVTMTGWALDLVGDADMHDQIRAKGYRAYGYALRLAAQPAAALDALRKAVDLNDRIGCKKDIERLERQVKNTPPAAEPAPAAPG